MPREYPPCDGNCNKVQGLISLEVSIDMKSGLLPLHKPEMMCGMKMACVDVMQLDEHGGNEYSKMPCTSKCMLTQYHLCITARWL